MASLNFPSVSEENIPWGRLFFYFSFHPFEGNYLAEWTFRCRAAMGTFLFVAAQLPSPGFNASQPASFSFC